MIATIFTKLDRLVDVVVASPGRLMQHKLQGNVFFSHVNTVIIDEVDTMLTQGFGKDIRDILKSSLKKQEQGEGEVQIIMATATLTKAVKSLLLDVEGKGLLTDAIGGKCFLKSIVQRYPQLHFAQQLLWERKRHQAQLNLKLLQSKSTWLKWMVFIGEFSMPILCFILLAQYIVSTERYLM